MSALCVFLLTMDKQMEKKSLNGCKNGIFSAMRSLLSIA